MEAPISHEAKGQIFLGSEGLTGALKLKCNATAAVVVVRSIIVMVVISNVKGRRGHCEISRTSERCL